jgi:hypothetical protein
MRTISAAFFFFLLASCSPSDTLEKGLTTQERAIVRGAVGDVSRGNTQALGQKVAPELSAKIPAAQPAMQSALPAAPFEMSLLSASWSITGPNRVARMVYEVHGKSGWALVEASTLTSDDRTALTSIYIQPTPAAASKLNGFELRSAGISHILMIVAMIVAVAVTIAALLRIWRSGRFSRRWLWTIGAIFGLTTLRLNWTTGAFEFQPISFLLFSVSAFKTPIYAPWVLSVAFPVVALIALLPHRNETESGAGEMTDAA